MLVASLIYHNLKCYLIICFRNQWTWLSWKKGELFTRGNLWCPTVVGVERFLNFVLSSPPLTISSSVREQVPSARIWFIFTRRLLTFSFFLLCGVSGWQKAKVNVIFLCDIKIISNTFMPEICWIFIPSHSCGFYFMIFFRRAEVEPFRSQAVSRCCLFKYLLIFMRLFPTRKDRKK